LAASASSFLAFSKTVFGAPSTIALASPRPRPVTSLTALITATFCAPASLRTTSYSAFSSAAGAATVAYATIKNRPDGQDFGNLQVAYMAPTEVLATQLFENFVEYFKHTGISIGLITGSGCRKFPSKTAQLRDGMIPSTVVIAFRNCCLSTVNFMVLFNYIMIMCLYLYFVVPVNKSVLP
jgi:hypothetical protein